MKKHLNANSTFMYYYVFFQNMNNMANPSPVDYVNPLMGTASNFSLSNSNTTSVIAILLEKDDLPLTISCSFTLLAKQLRYGANELLSLRRIPHSSC